MRATIIKWTDKGFGFAKPDDDLSHRDIFVHHKSLPKNIGNKIGLRAESVRIIDPEPVAAPKPIAPPPPAAVTPKPIDPRPVPPKIAALLDADQQTVGYPSRRTKRDRNSDADHAA